MATVPPSKKARKSKSSSSSTPPLGKFLASSEKTVRDKAVASLSRFLSGSKTAGSDEAELEVGDLDWSTDFTPDKRLDKEEMDKLWKGIFFCFWMSDKPLVQQALADSLAELTLAVRSKGKEKGKGRVERVKSALCYIRGFWSAVVREWSGLDRLRLDKFYLLIRRFIQASFVLLRREAWDRHAIALYSELLTGPEGPLNVTEQKLPHSLPYHVADIYIDELQRALASPIPHSPTPSSEELKIPLIALLSPFLYTLSQAPTSIMFNRVVENVFLPLLPTKPTPPSAVNGRKRSRDTQEAGDQVDAYAQIFAAANEGQGKAEVGNKVLRALFDEGGKQETVDSNRRKIYLLVREWGQEALED